MLSSALHTIQASADSMGSMGSTGPFAELHYLGQINQHSTQRNAVASYLGPIMHSLAETGTEAEAASGVWGEVVDKHAQAE